VVSAVVVIEVASVVVVTAVAVSAVAVVVIEEDVVVASTSEAVCKASLARRPPLTSRTSSLSLNAYRTARIRAEPVQA